MLAPARALLPRNRLFITVTLVARICDAGLIM